MTVIIQAIVLSLLFISTSWADTTRMHLLGSGETRYLGLIKVFEARLYADPDQSSDILDNDVSRCLSLTYDVELTAQDFVRGAEKVLAQQHSQQKIQTLRNEIDTLHHAYQDVSAGDTYTLCYNAGERRTSLSLNKRELTAITSADFARLYFGIWLGEKMPIDDELRRDLLAGTLTGQGG